MVVFSIMVALYTLSYVVLGEQVYVEVLVESFLARPWGIYTHAFFAMIALALGPFQFRGLMIEHRPPIHRTLGKIYVVGALMTQTLPSGAGTVFRPLPGCCRAGRGVAHTNRPLSNSESTTPRPPTDRQT